MVRVVLHVDHPGVYPEQRFEATLPQLPRVDEYIREADTSLFQRTGAHAEAELWKVLAVVHEPPNATAEATLYVIAADMRNIFDLFEGEPGD